MSQLQARGHLTIKGGTIHFSAQTIPKGRGVTGNGTFSPQIPSPGIDTDNAYFYFNNIDTLPGDHDLVGGNIGRNDVNISIKASFPEPTLLKIIAEASLDSQISISSGSINFNVTG